MAGPTELFWFPYSEVRLASNTASGPDDLRVLSIFHQKKELVRYKVVGVQSHRQLRSGLGSPETEVQMSAA